MRLSNALLGLASLLIALPAPAGVRHHVTLRPAADGGHARVHRTVVAGDGRRAWHAGGTAAHADGSLSHVRAGGVAGADGRAVRGSRTTVGDDGTLSHQAGHVIHGANGATEQGRHSYQRAPDGSVQAGYTASGQNGAGGSFQSSGSRTRSADGERAASRQTTASGARGSYAGSVTRGDGTITKERTITGAAGNSYQGHTSYTRGEGVSHTGTCTNAQGQTIQC